MPQTEAVYMNVVKVDKFRLGQHSHNFRPHQPNSTVNPQKGQTQTKRLRSAALNHLLSNRLRDRRILVKFHREGATTAGHRAHIGGIAKHFTQRDTGGNRLYTTSAWLHAPNFAATAREVADDITDILFGDNRLNLHDW